MLKVFSAFTGYGGLCSWGLTKAKIQHEIIGWSETDKYAIQCYQNNFPQYKDLNQGYITQINPEELSDFDLFTGGFPCQSFSVAGKRKGFDMKFINSYKVGSERLPYKVIDVMQLFYGNPKLINHKLGTVCKAYNIPLDAHNCESDIYATFKLFKLIYPKF